MSDKKSSKLRRKVLKSIATSTGAVVAGKSLPENWSKPVVNSVLLPAHAQTSPPATCNIAGVYCWQQTNTLTTITVLADGTITIMRVNTNNSNAWEGTGNTSNGALGGAFDITATRTSGVPSLQDVNYTGIVVCNSTDISGNFDNPNTGSNINYTATQGACP